jgi:hypothetical protein
LFGVRGPAEDTGADEGSAVSVVHSRTFGGMLHRLLRGLRDSLLRGRKSMRLIPRFARALRLLLLFVSFSWENLLLPPNFRVASGVKYPRVRPSSGLRINTCGIAIYKFFSFVVNGWRLGRFYGVKLDGWRRYWLGGFRECFAGGSCGCGGSG